MCLTVSCLWFHDDRFFVVTSASNADTNAYSGVLLCEFSCSQSECSVFGKGSGVEETWKSYKDIIFEGIKHYVPQTILSKKSET